MALSPFALQAMGVHYSSIGGNPVTKIHPATYVIAAAFGLFMYFRAPNPARLADWGRERGWLIGSVLGFLVIFLYKLCMDGASNIAFLIDTFLGPALLVTMLADAPWRYRSRLAQLIVALLIVNAIVGLLEVRLHFRIFPYVINGQIKVEEFFRPTAFLGHPLQNAMLTACGLIALAALPWPLLVRLGCAGIFGLALLAFGGRTAAVTGIGGLLFLLCIRVNLYVRGGRHALAFACWLAMILGSLTAAGMAAILFQTHFGERVLGGGLGDASTMVRVHIFDIFDNVDMAGLLMGYSGDEIDQLMVSSHLIDIESFWVALLLHLGLNAFIIWLVALIAIAGFVWRSSDSAGRTIVACVVLIASTSVSLSTKNSLLDIVLALSLGTGMAQSARTWDQPAGSRGERRSTT